MRHLSGINLVQSPFEGGKDRKETPCWEQMRDLAWGRPPPSGPRCPLCVSQTAETDYLPALVTSRILCSRRAWDTVGLVLGVWPLMSQIPSRTGLEGRLT